MFGPTPVRVLRRHAAKSVEQQDDDQFLEALSRSVRHHPAKGMALISLVNRHLPAGEIRTAIAAALGDTLESTLDAT